MLLSGAVQLRAHTEVDPDPPMKPTVAFGTEGFLKTGHRMATALALEPSEVLQYSMQNQVMAASEEDREDAEGGQRALNGVLQGYIRECLTQVQLFSSFPAPSLTRLSELFELTERGPGVYLCVQDEMASDFFVLLSGTVQIIKDDTLIKTLHVKGEANEQLPFLGEGALLHGKARVASVVTHGACQLLELREQHTREVQKLLMAGGGNEVQKQLHQLIAARARQAEVIRDIAMSKQEARFAETINQVSTASSVIANLQVRAQQNAARSPARGRRGSLPDVGATAAAAAAAAASDGGASSPGSSAPSPTKSIGGSFASRQRRGSVQLEAVITRDRGSIELGG